MQYIDFGVKLYFSSERSTKYYIIFWEKRIGRDLKEFDAKTKMHVYAL
jgi:hypothetical protein